MQLSVGAHSASACIAVEPHPGLTACFKPDTGRKRVEFWRDLACCDNAVD